MFYTSISYLFHSHLTCEYPTSVITLILCEVIIMNSLYFTHLFHNGWTCCLHMYQLSTSSSADDKAASTATIDSLHDPKAFCILALDIPSSSRSPSSRSAVEPMAPTPCRPRLAAFLLCAPLVVDPQRMLPSVPWCCQCHCCDRDCGCGCV